MATKLQDIARRNVRTVWVRDWTVQFLKGLAKVSTKTEIVEYCLEQKKAFDTEIQRRSQEEAEKENKELEPTSWMNTAATYMSQVRKAIKEWEKTIKLNDENSYDQPTQRGTIKQHLSLNYMKYPRDIHEKRKQPTEAKKNEQRRNLTPIKCVDKYLETINKLINSTDYREIAVGLIAATGRRMSEILSTAVFTQIGQFEVEFEGQIKAREEERKYVAFTLIESAKVIDSLYKLRRMPEIKEMKNWNLAEIDSGKNAIVNSKVKEAFSELIQPPHGETQLSSKNLRAAYAAIAIYLFCPDNHSEGLFIKERLGHTSDGIASSYEDYRVTDSSGKALVRGAWIDRINEKIIKPMQVLTNMRLRLTLATKKVINDEDFLPYPDQASRMEELIRLARIGKQYEEGKLVKEVVKVVEVIKEVEKPVEAIKEVKAAQPVVEEVKSISDRFREMSDEELRGCQAPGSELEKIRRSVQAIKTYNEQQAEKNHQWAINVSTLEDLSGCHSKAVRDYLDSDEGRLQVTDYNLEKGFGFQQNRGKGKITKFVRW